METTVLKIVRIAITVLSERLLTILCMSMAFALACWAMWHPENGRLITLGLFAILVYIPLMLQQRKKNEDPPSQSE
jgi:hypothetical protein